MVLQGYLNYRDDGMTVASRAMMTQVERFKLHADNIANASIPGYQRKDEILTSFAEYLGPDGVNSVTSPEIGRLRMSGNALDFALNTPGYFQKLNPDGSVELTRDGRFKTDTQGNLLSLDNKKILSSAGVSIQFPTPPQNPEKQVRVSSNGEIVYLDTRTGKLQSLGYFGIAGTDGTPVQKAEIKQNYVEDSNVFLQNEFVGVVPIRRNFEANRQIFITNSDELSRMIQELGRTQ